MPSINFEQDQTESFNQINDAKVLSDQVVKLRSLEDKFLQKEEELKKNKTRDRSFIW